MDKKTYIIVEADNWQQILEEIREIRKELRRNQYERWAKRWITNEELQKRLNISPKTSQNYRDEGLIKFSQVGNKIYFKNEDVDDFLLRHQIVRRGGDR